MARTIEKCVSDYEASIRKLLKILELKTKSNSDLAQFDRLKKRISLLKLTVGLEQLLEISSSYLIKHAEKIIRRDEEFMMRMDIRQEVANSGVAVGPNDEYIYSLIESIRDLYASSSQSEKDIVYNEVRGLLGCCAEYKIIKGQFKK